MRKPIEISVDYTLDFFTITEWRKKAGDRIEKGEALLIYETQKENVELTAEVSGTLAEILAPSGEQIFRPENVTHGGWSGVAGYIETESTEHSTPKTEEKKDSVPEKPEAEKQTTKPSTERLVPNVIGEKPKEKIRMRMKADGTTEEITPHTVAPQSEGGIKSSPLVRDTARKMGIDLVTVRSTGPEGTITIEDLGRKTPTVDRMPRQKEDRESSLFPLTTRRKSIASNLEKSWREIPHAGSEVIVNLSRVAEKRASIKKELSHDPEMAKILSRWDPFVLRAIVHNLSGHIWDRINSTFTHEGILLHEHVNIGISIADRHGLIVPVIHRAENMRWKELAAALDALYKGVRENTLKASDYKKGTFTFNNPGALGGHNGSSIIPYNSGSAILSLHAIDKDFNTILGIRFDHRAYDGFEALGFLTDVKKFLETLDENIL